MKTKLSFGDIVINGWASERNPQKVLMVVHVGKYVKCLSRSGKKVLFSNDRDLRLTPTGRIDFSLWDYEIETQSDKK